MHSFWPFWPFRAESIHLRPSAVLSRDPRPTARLVDFHVAERFVNPIPGSILEEGDKLVVVNIYGSADREFQHDQVSEHRSPV